MRLPHLYTFLLVWNHGCPFPSHRLSSNNVEPTGLPPPNHENSKKSVFHPFPFKKMIHLLLLVISQFAMKHGPLRGTISLRKMRNFPSPGSSGGTQLSGLRGISGIAGASWVSTVMGWGPGHESEGYGKIMGRWWTYGDWWDWMVIIGDFIGFMLLWWELDDWM